MNRQQRRLSEKEGRRVQTLPWNAFEKISAAECTLMSAQFRLSFTRFDGVWRNNHYIVFLTKKERHWSGIFWDRVMVRRSDAQAIYCWSDLFRIKCELFGEETEGIDFLPAKSMLVDVANLYWFFIPSKGTK